MSAPPDVSTVRGQGGSVDERRIAEIAERLKPDFGHHKDCTCWYCTAVFLLSALRRARQMCSTCAGTGKPVSGRPCVCGGRGDAMSEAQGLREELYRAREERDEARRALSLARRRGWPSK